MSNTITKPAATRTRALVGEVWTMPNTSHLLRVNASAPSVAFMAVDRGYIGTRVGAEQGSPPRGRPR